MKTIVPKASSYVFTSSTLVLHIVSHLRLWQQMRAQVVFSKNLCMQLTVLPLQGEDGSSGVMALMFFSSRSRVEALVLELQAETKLQYLIIVSSRVHKQSWWIHQLLNSFMNVTLETWHVSAQTAAASCLFIYIYNEIPKYACGFLAVYCTTTWWSSIKMHLLWMKTIFFLYF